MSLRSELHHARVDAYAAKMRVGNTPTTRTTHILKGWPRGREIIRAIAAKYGLEPFQLQKDGRNGGRFRSIVQARAEAMAAIRRDLGYSFPLIGRIFGGFHHTSVMYLVKTLEAAPPVEKPSAEVQLDALERKATELLQGIAELRPMVKNAK
jgi:chromosomal replication initiation ATPase DnaA